MGPEYLSGMLISAVWWVAIIGALVYRFVLKPNKNRQAAQAGDKESFGIMGAVVSGIGALVGTLFYPLLGAILCAGGLILSIVGAVKGAKDKVGLIISVICTIWTVGFFLYIFPHM